MEGADLKSQISNLKSNFVIIVAGGSGSRMQSAVPKQFLLLAGKPVLMHTIENFHNSSAQPEIIVVLPVDFHEYWKELCAKHDFTILHQLISGGATRFHSVKNGLDTIVNPEAVIAVHDAVRPLTDKETIEQSFYQARELGNSVVAVKSRDSVRVMDDDNSRCVNRDDVYLVQTPQTFQYAQLKNAYQQEYTSKFTDDASVVEETGIKINLLEGTHRNIKITYPEDIAIAEAIMGKSS